MKRYSYRLNAIYFIYSENCVTAFKENFIGSFTKVLREAKQKAKSLKCDNWYIISIIKLGGKEAEE